MRPHRRDAPGWMRRRSVTSTIAAVPWPKATPTSPSAARRDACEQQNCRAILNGLCHNAIPSRSCSSTLIMINKGLDFMPASPQQDALGLWSSMSNPCCVEFKSLMIGNQTVQRPTACFDTWKANLGSADKASYLFADSCKTLFSEGLVREIC